MSKNIGKVEITVSNNTILRIIGWLVATALVIIFFKSISKPLSLIFASGFLALALNPVVTRIAGKLKSNSRARATAASYLVVVLILGLMSFFVLVPLARQTIDFVKDAPSTARDFESQDTSLGRFAKRIKLGDQINGVTKRWTKQTVTAGAAIGTASTVGNFVISLLTILVLTFMLLIEGPKWIKKIWEIHPDGDRENRDKVILHRMYKAVTGYVNGQLLIALIAGAFAAVALIIGKFVFNADINPFALAGIIIICGLIPMVGNTIGAAIVVLACLPSSTVLALAAAAFFLVYQQIENITIQPMIVAKSNDMTPLTVFVAAVVGVSAGGVLGGFVAIPAFSCIKILLEDYLDHRS